MTPTTLTTANTATPATTLTTVSPYPHDATLILEPVVNYSKPLLHWKQLTQYGMPEFRVIRRPLNTGFATLAVGAVYPSPDPRNAGQVKRTRQYYDARRIAPVHVIRRSDVIRGVYTPPDTLPGKSAPPIPMSPVHVVTAQPKPQAASSSPSQQSMSLPSLPPLPGPAVSPVPSAPSSRPQPAKKG